MFRQKLLLVALIGSLLGGCIGSSENAIDGNTIPHPGNLVADTQEILTSGAKEIIITNNGQSPVNISNATINNQQTANDIDTVKTDCYGTGSRILGAKQTCKVTLNVYPGEAGISELNLHTNNGVYQFPIKVDTTPEGVFAVSSSEIASTKEQALNIINKGVVALMIKSFTLESGNHTLKAQDINCINHLIDAGGNCQIKVQASPNEEMHHTLVLSTNNKYLRTQTLDLHETTTKNLLVLLDGETIESQSKIVKDKPGSYTYTIKNTGTDDINISKVSLNADNIGSLNSACDGKKLQAGDSCDLRLNIKNNAYGKVDLITNTVESIEHGFNHSIEVTGANITINDSDYLTVHHSATKTVTIKNNSNFVIDVDSIDYDSNNFRFTSNCSSGTLLAGRTCTGTIYGINTTDTGYINFNASGGKVKQSIKVHVTKNLVPDTYEVKRSGVKEILIKNEGQTSIQINTGELNNQETADRIDIANTDCYGVSSRTLSPNETCKIGLNVYSGEAGISELKLQTTDGSYSFPVEIDTTAEGVFVSDTKEIKSTKEQTIKILNKSAVALTIKSFNLEADNVTLSAKNVSCLNNKVGAGKECQIKVQASPGQYIHHTLKLATSNAYLKPQAVYFRETTNNNSLSLLSDNNLENHINIIKDTPGNYAYTIKNTGTNDININSVSLSADNIGSLTSACDGNKLQAGDSCELKLNIRNNAYGKVDLITNTAENLESSFNHSIEVAGADLSINQAHDVVLHNSATKNVVITNNSRFTLDLNSISYDMNNLRFSSTCTGSIPAGASCSGTISGINTTDTGYINFNAFGGRVNHQIRVHVTNGVSTIFQPMGNAYYTLLPQDSHFYQVFTVVNNSNREQRLSLSNRFPTLVQLMTYQDISQNSFINPNCVQDADGNLINVSANSICEIILREPNNLDQLQQLIMDTQNSDRGNFRISVEYGDGEVFINKYQSVVGTRQMHREQTYSKGSKLSLNTTASTNGCNMLGQLFSYYNYDPGTTACNDRGGCWSTAHGLGIIINADLLDNNTITGTYYEFSNAYGSECGYPFKISLLSYQTDVQIDAVGTNNGTLKAFMRSGSNCNNNQCNIIISATRGDDPQPANLHRYGFTFAKPISAADWVEATGITWQDLGAVTLKQSRVVVKRLHLL